MARKKRRENPPDLAPYLGCAADQTLGFDPLAVGWLDHRTVFPTGEPPAEFAQKLLPYCFEQYTVCQWARAQPCPLDNQPIPSLQQGKAVAYFGRSEIRVIGETDIYAAPTLIYHFVTVHQYLPPTEFIAAVVEGPPPGSPEHRALIRALRGAG